MWEDHGLLRKNIPVGMATISLSELPLDKDVTGRYLLFLPRRTGPTVESPSDIPRPSTGHGHNRPLFRIFGNIRHASTDGTDGVDGPEENLTMSL